MLPHREAAPEIESAVRGIRLPKFAPEQSFETAMPDAGQTGK
ncbi:hypothetical protein [Paenibacillus sp. KR2-11]